MKTFWLSWYEFEPFITEEAATFQIWYTGWGAEDAETMCAYINAETQDQAWKQVESVYPRAQTRIRFIVENDFGWRPDPSRFP